MSIARLAAVLLLAAAAAPAAYAGDCMPVLESPWIRKPPMAMPMMAGFATIRNPCPASVTLVGASSPAFGAVELHETRRVDGVSRMRHVESLDVPAGGAVTLAPGGLHLMLMRPQADAAIGESLEVELELADGRTLGAAFQVRDATAR
ncbi:copper chaperone PCu(A)C [Luteimonas kalidii]|uniref:Copper chaperone PCu(A)C n=1 Tax=Luteimonas kalidii TaxID=3042025 RepID=A0ABT6JPL8_9GAMM|nr:copper chaperone PCu(A)C [Luteimonas kalidii]MDH5832452.1 copper chaperone PCu(A)C [Luteimonas kalidii]